MKPEEIKKLAEEKALERYPKKPFSQMDEVRRKAYAQCFIDNYKESDAVEFGKFLGTKCFRVLKENGKEYWCLFSDEYHQEYTTKEIYELFHNLN